VCRAAGPCLGCLRRHYVIGYAARDRTRPLYAPAAAGCAQRGLEQGQKGSRHGTRRSCQPLVALEQVAGSGRAVISASSASRPVNQALPAPPLTARLAA